MAIPPYYTTLCFSHFLLWKRRENTIPRTVQSVNIPIHTAIGPKPLKRIRYTQRQKRNVHIVIQDVIIENFTSPAARSPYGGINARVHTIGLTTVIQDIIWKHILALSGSIPPSFVTGMVKANTKRQLATTMISARTLNFLI